MRSSASGTLGVTLTTSYSNWQLHVRTVCTGNMTSNELACVWGYDPGFSVDNPNALSFPVTSGITYYVAADSWDGTSVGTFTLTLSLN